MAAELELSPTISAAGSMTGFSGLVLEPCSRIVHRERHAHTRAGAWMCKIAHAVALQAAFVKKCFFPSHCKPLLALDTVCKTRSQNWC
eukprot:1132342-Amphidinium_carterae.1